MNASAAANCSNPRKVIAVCIVRSAIRSARLFKREVPAAHNEKVTADDLKPKLVRAIAKVLFVLQKRHRGVDVTYLVVTM
jgi:hypothetical protein